MVGPVENVTVAGDIRRLARTVEEIIDALRAQRELLRQRGMSLPPGSLGGLKEVYDSLQGMADQLTSDATELEQLRALAETTTLINSSLDINHVLNGVMDTVIALTRAERGYIVLREEKTGQMEFRIARNFDRETIDEQELIVSRSIVEEVAQTGKDVQTTDALSDPNYSGRESVVFHGLRSILCVPLMVRDEVTGVVYVDNRIKNAFGEQQHQLLVDFANQAATAIENARLFGRVRTALAEITEMKELMDNVFASIASGVITTDVSDIVTAYNSAAERILEVPSQRALGQGLESALPLIYTHIRSLFDDVYQHSEQKILKLDPVLPGRGTVNLDLKLSPLRNEEAIEGVAIVVDDLTEINRRDAKLNVIRRYLPPALVDNIQSLDELGLGGERRVITVVFVEARPFHTFPPDLRPQELMELLNLYLTVGAEAIHNQAGVVDKFMGNEIMGLFNTQLNPTEDHAWWAVQAALHMADDYVALAQQIGEDPIPYYRIAIHTGVATMGNVGSASRREFTAIGHTVNLAKRLQENATPGQIIISDETCRQCYAQLTDPASGILVLERPSIQMKGIRQMVQIFEVQHAPAEARSGER